MTSRRLLLSTLMVALNLSSSWAQDIRIIEQSAYRASEEAITEAAKNNPIVLEWQQRITISEITYLSDGLKVKGFLVTPAGTGKYPCLIYNRGGSLDFGALERDAVPVGFLARLASAGYVVVASQYRGNMGGEGREEYGGSEVNDVLNLLPLLDSMPQCDSSRIGMYGRSRGGMMTYLALTRTRRILAAVVDAGLADLMNTAKEHPEMEKRFSELIPNFANNRVAAMEARSAVRWPEKLNKTTPLLLLHGTSDQRASAEQALIMAQALYKTKHPFRMVLFEGGQHSLEEHRTEADRIIIEWFDTYVRDRQKWPSLDRTFKRPF